jgi:outer membrane murein-binding lipoprotein Lpp
MSPSESSYQNTENKSANHSSVNKKLTQSIEDLQKLSVSLLRSARIFHVIGYGLLILSLFDYIVIVLDPSPKNAAWTFQTVGQFVERVPVPLLGLGLVFFIGQNFRAKWESVVLKVLSWLSLLAAIFYLLLLPLGVISTVKLEQQASAQFNAQIERGQQGLEQAREQLNAADTPEELQILLASLNAQGRAPEIAAVTSQFQELKEQLGTFINQTQENLVAQATEARKNRRINLIRNSVKWNLGAIISAVLFAIIWKLTKWLR